MALLTVRDATAIYGYSGTYLRLLITTGKLKAKKYGCTWLIDSRALDAYMRLPHTKGRPKLS